MASPSGKTSFLSLAASGLQCHLQVRNRFIRTCPLVVWEHSALQQHQQVGNHRSWAWPPVACNPSAIQQHPHMRNHPFGALPSETCEKGFLAGGGKNQKLVKRSHKVSKPAEWEDEVSQNVMEKLELGYSEGSVRLCPCKGRPSRSCISSCEIKENMVLSSVKQHCPFLLKITSQTWVIMWSEWNIHAT